MNDPVRKMEQLNIEDWQREEATAGREPLWVQIVGLILVLAFIAVIAWVGGMAYEHYLRQGYGW